MATLLHRIGAFSVRHRRSVIVAWLALIVALGAVAISVRQPFADAFSIPGTESQRAIELIEQRTPGSNAEGATGRVVFAAAQGETLTGTQAKQAVQDTTKAIADVPGVASATDPYAVGGVSKAGRIAYTEVQFDLAASDVGEPQTDGIAAATRAAERAGLQVEFGGAATARASDPPIGEAVGFLAALVVLGFTFASLFAASLPLLSGVIAVAAGALGVLIANSITAMSATSVTLVVMLGLAVGIDYTLFILSRHRTQVRDGMPIEASIAKAVGTAGSAVVFAGLTVVVALAAMFVTGVPFLTQMGIAAAGTIGVAVLVSLTFVPACLAIAGPRAVKGKNFSVELAGADGKPTMGTRWVDLVMRHRIAAAVLVTAGLIALAIPATHMRLGLPDDGTANPDTTTRQAYDLMAEGFGPGFSGPLLVVATVPTDRAQSATDAAVARLQSLPDVAEISPAQLNPAKDLAIIQVIPVSAPSSEQTETLVTRIRDEAPRIRQDTGATIYVGGSTASNIDVSQKLSSALVPYLIVVISIAMLLLLLAFRSIVVPLTAIGGFLLTILAAFGAVVAVFQDGFGAGLIGVATEAPIISLLPVLIIGVIFGLAMDYQVFLVSRMREDFIHGGSAQTAVRDGFRHGARVVTAAALIMTSVFAGFILPDDPIIKSIGFAFALGILLDAFLVRMTLIPALMSILGERAWWIPRWLDRILPNVDIEGAALERADDPQHPKP